MSRKEQLIQEESLNTNGRLSPAETLRRNVNNVVQPLLTDLYQITMAYAYWKSGKRNSKATFDLFFRKNPFHGEFTIFAGLEECLRFLQNFNYTVDDIEYLKSVLPETTDGEFFEYLQNLTAEDVTVYAIPEGSVAFPKVPLLRVEGPLPVCQLLETTLLTLINFASLIATNATRYRIASGKEMQLLEFGLRRAQGPDGGLSASKYAYVGGFDATSNVLAGKLYGIPVKGTHAHAFVMAYTSVDELPKHTMRRQGVDEDGEEEDFVACCLKWQESTSKLLKIIQEEASPGEFAAFIAYAISFPNSFLALIDTYDVMRRGDLILHPNEVTLIRLRSGVLNFCAVALALNEFGYIPIGVRIDSGDLAYLSTRVKEYFSKVANELQLDWFNKLTIVASNDINEDTILALNEQGHQINCFGIGTHLVTCQRQPALGCVYKLVEIDDKPCIKLSLDVEKVTIPGKKLIYRLYGQDGSALLDLMQLDSEDAPSPGHRVLCRHPFQESKRAYVTPSKVELLLEKRWSSNGLVIDDGTEFNLRDTRNKVLASLATIRSDIKRYLNPTPYKVSVSDHLYQYIHDLWLQNAPIGELR